MPHHSGRDQASSDFGSNRMLEALWVEFVRLQCLRREIISDFGMAVTTSAGCDDDRELADKVFLPIADEMDRIACQAAAIGSKSPVDMEYKAIMLAEYLSQNQNTLHAVLARSLVEDIKACTWWR